MDDDRPVTSKIEQKAEPEKKPHWKYPTRDEIRAREAANLQFVMRWPDAAQVGLYTLCALEYVSASQGWENVKSNAWPKPIRVGRAVRFSLGEYRKVRGLPSVP